MRSTLRIFACLAVVALVAPVTVLAGTRTEPEISDPPEDTSDGGEPVFAPGSDVVAAWFEEGSSTFSVHVRVADLAPPVVGRAEMWRLEWDADGETFFADAERFFDGSRTNLYAADFTGDGFPSTQAGTATVAFDLAADEIVMTFPKAFTVTPFLGVPRDVAFGCKDVFASPSARAFVGTGTSSIPTLYTLVDVTSTGLDFMFVEDCPSLTTYSGTRPFRPITASDVVLDGRPVSSESGDGPIGTFSFRVVNQPKSLTFDGVSYPLPVGAVVTIHAFEGRYTVTPGSVKFAGLAASLTIA